MPNHLSDLYAKKVAKAVLLINLGTPSKPTYFGVYKFLSQFLSDKRVIPLNKILWWPLLHCLILPLRCRSVSEKYKLIWQKDGSPLLSNMKAIQSKLDKKHTDIDFFIGMRYGQPSIRSCVEKIANYGYEEITIIPLFPQYSDTTSGTALFEVMDQLKRYKYTPSIKFIHDFCNNQLYISSIVQATKEFWLENKMGDSLIISFHGLPDESFELGDPYKHCCMQTANAIIQQLNSFQSNVHIVFQSRFGPKKWLQPYAESTIKQLANNGAKTIDVIAPSFYVDCLETLEEIQHGYRALFIEHGGKALRYIPCLNDSEQSISLISELIDK